MQRATRRASVAPAAGEAAGAEVPGLVGAASTARTARRRQSVAHTPAAATAPAAADGAAPKTAASMRGRRRRSSVSPAPDSAAKEVGTPASGLEGLLKP